MHQFNGSLVKRVKGISIICKDNVLVIKDKHDVFLLLRIILCWQQMTGFRQIGKIGSGHVFTLLVVSPKSDD